RADSLLFRSFLMLYFCFLLALTLAFFGWQQLDAYFCLGIALYILWSALQIARETVSVLMYEELPAYVSTRMLALACEV
ncbi:CDF family cation-efflux transporter FieF, partial [Pseudomonas syringae pv. tagetis]